MSTIALAGAVLAGALTTLAPCTLPLLPVIVGGSAAGAQNADARRRALVIAGGLGLSVFAFTLLLRASTALIAVPPTVWSALAGGLLIGLGLVSLLPRLWDRLSMRLGLGARTQQGLATARSREGVTGAALTGAALGPVFTSCSPLYAYVIVTVLPAEPVYGVALLSAYVIGLSATLLAISLAGQRLVRRLGWAADPHGWFRRALGTLFVLVGVAVLTGWDQQLQTWLLEYSPIRPWELEGSLIPQG